MAKKKISTEGVINSLIKEHGEVFLDPQEVLDKKRDVFSLSPKLDIALSGGIPSGCWGIISGLSKLGKSTLALKICAEAQKVGRKCYYQDVECRLEKKNLLGIPGLDLNPDKFQVVKSTKGNILTAEKHLDIAENLIKNEEGIILVLDSSSALCSTQEYESDMEDVIGRNHGPKLLAKFTRKLAQLVPTQDVLVIIIQHLMANTSGYGSPWLEDGGNKIFYQADFKLRGVSYSKWEENNQQVGQVVNWHIIAAALGQPGAKVQSYLRFGQGVDEVMELIELACEVGVITKGGAWFNLDFLETPEKIQGQTNVWKRLKDSPDDLKSLKEKVNEIYL